MIESNSSSSLINTSNISNPLTQTESSIEQVGGTVNSYHWVNTSSTANDKKFAQAVRDKNYDVADFMIKNDMVRSYGYKDKNNSSPLHYLANNLDDKRARAIMKAILTRSPPTDVVNSVDNSGDTPLILSVRAGDSKMANNLINKGADMNIRNTRGEVVVFNTQESPSQSNDSPLTSDIESDNILERLERKFIETPKQHGGGIKGERVLNHYPHGVSSGRRESKASLVHKEVLQSIIGLLKVDEVTAKAYKSIVYASVKEKNPELGSLDRANKLKEEVTLEKLKLIDKSKVKTVVAEIKKKMQEKAKENPKE